MQLNNNIDLDIRSLPTEYENDLMQDIEWEKEFKDIDKHWYSPFILWDKNVVKEYQPDTDESFINFLAIGSNGGSETYFLSLQEGTIHVCDLIAGVDSMNKVASTYFELKLLLSN